MRGFPTPNRLFWRYDERDGAASGALQGGRPDAARLRRPPEARPPRPGPPGRRVGTGGVARTRGVGGDLRRRARPCWSDWLERMPSCPRAPPFGGNGHWDVVLSGMVDGRMRLLATIPLDEWIRPQRGYFFRGRASGPLWACASAFKEHRRCVVGARLHVDEPKTSRQPRQSAVWNCFDVGLSSFRPYP